MKTNYDVIIVGLGPAGATASYYLAKKGFSILALDKSKFPRIKPCGGGITAKGKSTTEIDWSSCIEHSAYRVKLVCRNQPSLSFTNQTPLVYMVSRPTFDSYLVSQAEKQGTVIQQNEKVKKVWQEDSQVKIETDEKVYTAKYLIGADGALGIVRRQIFGDAPKTKLFVAAETESCPANCTSSTSNEEIYFHLGSVPWGYGWVFGKNIYQSVGVYGSVEKMKNPVNKYHQFVNDYATQVKDNYVPIRVHPVPVYSAKNPVVKNRVLLVGDAAGLVDPLLGEGIYYALYSGRCAGETIAKYFDSETKVMQEHEKRIQIELGQNLAIAEKLSNLIYRFPSLSFRLFRSYPELFHQFCQVLGGTLTYNEFIKQVKPILLSERPLLSRFLLGMERLRVLSSN